MEEGNRPCKRKRTNPGEENSSDSYENLEYNRDRHRSKSASFRLEDRESPQSCDCDKNRLNCNQNCSMPSASVILSPSNCNNCNQVKCNLYQTDQICNCNQSYSKCDTNVMCNDSCTSKGQYSGGISSSQSTYKIPCIARVPQDVPKILSTDRQTLAKSSLEELKLSVEQCTPKVSTSVEIGLKDGQNNKEANTALQGSSKVDTSGSSKTSENFAAPETSCQTISDPKLPVDPLMNSGLPFDPLVNLCSCSSSSSSPSRGEGSYQICNPGFEVLCSPGEKNSQKSNADPECGEDMGDGEKEGEERKTSGEGKNALICERSAVTDLISSRRATKFRIQKSLGQSSENIRKFSWNSNGEKDESADMDAHLSDSESENKANCRPTHEKPERAVYNAFRARFTSENLVNKEAYSNLTSVAHINKLPASILVNILRHLRMCDLLHRASLVCKLWHQLVYDPDLWRKIDLRYQHKVTDEQLVTLTQISDRVTHIDISDTQNLTSEAVDVALKWCSHLRSLHMSRCYKLMDSVLLTLGSNCRRLRTLVMDGCYKITDEGLCRVAEGCRDLEKINLSRCSHHVTDRGVVAIAENCPQLREVILGYLSEVTDTSCVRLCELCPHLEIVTLMFSGVSEQGVRALKKLRKLKIIDISSLPGIAPADVATLTQFCPDLQAMNVSLNPEINDECLLQVIKYGRHLHLLQCVSCHITDKFLSEVGRHTSTLRNLDIGWCQSVTDAGVRALSASCPSLRYLGLIRCDAVTADAIEELMAEFPQITYSTFILESKKLIERARREGFMFREDQNNVDMLV